MSHHRLQRALIAIAMMAVLVAVPASALATMGDTGAPLVITGDISDGPLLIEKPGDNTAETIVLAVVSTLAGIAFVTVVFVANRKER